MVKKREKRIKHIISSLYKIKEINRKEPIDLPILKILVPGNIYGKKVIKELKEYKVTTKELKDFPIVAEILKDYI